MAQIPKGGLVKGPYKPICRDCAIYFSTTITEQELGCVVSCKNIRTSFLPETLIWTSTSSWRMTSIRSFCWRAGSCRGGRGRQVSMNFICSKTIIGLSSWIFCNSKKSKRSEKLLDTLRNMFWIFCNSKKSKRSGQLLDTLRNIFCWPHISSIYLEPQPTIYKWMFG